jgi:hypothetical protein
MDKIKEFLNCLLHFNMPKSNAAVEKNPENGNISLITNSKEKI